jgi:probable HAF family extracellular repeat protein
MRPIKNSTAVIVAALVIASAQGVALAQVRFISLARAGNSETFAYGVSANGRYVVGSDSATAIGHAAVRWDLVTGEQLVLGRIAGSGGSFSRAHAVSADGTVITGIATRDTVGSRAFRWTSSTGMQSIGDLPGGIENSYGFAVSADGAVIAGRGTSSGGSEAFRWTQSGGMMGLGELPGGEFGSVAMGASGDGSVLTGSSAVSGGSHAFRWSQETGIQDIGSLGTGETSARAITPDGAVVVGRSDGRAFRWTSAQGMVELPDLPGGRLNAYAKAISADGTIVVGTGQSTPSGGDEPVIWLPGRSAATSLTGYLQDELHLDLAGWSLGTCEGISADGTVLVGYGTAPGGVRQAWAAVIPAPSGLVLFAFTAACVSTRRRSRATRRSASDRI